MNNIETFSRAYLQGVPEQKKQELLYSIIINFHGSLIQTAQTGKTSYMVEQSVLNGYNNNNINPPLPKFTYDELIVAIKKKYPDCKVTYESTWVDTGINNRTRKEGIVIDWS
jgi:hypothetical protein